MKPRTFVYIDGFNLYYGALRGTPYRWLDLRRLCQLMLPRHDVRTIKYFTALVRPLPDDPDQPVRQQAYLRALGTLTDCLIIYGHFLSHKVWMPRADVPGKREYVRVVKQEEKGSDVNLATHLLCDAFDDAFDTAVIVSNDSDLAGPIDVVRNRFQKRIGIMNPRARPSRELLKRAHFYKRIRQGPLTASQFAYQLEDQHGVFHKPEGW